MARSLEFQIGGASYPATPAKIERKKLYGWTETLALDNDGNECFLATIDETGSVIIPKGGAALGRLTPERRWADRGELKAVTSDGTDAAMNQSSYDAPIPLTRVATADDLLDHCITAFYQITDADQALLDQVGDKIFTFEYFYNAGYSGKQAFLLANDGFLYMLVGEANRFPLAGLDETGIIEEDAEDEQEAEGGDIDFSMF
ncbi:MAG: hypothetical protein LBQ16_07425 [Gracilibacteraceae bacterium]|jgi:hypothetical protein|nr:hypothetical protein [Gracilibacteraceae bacterium]